MHLTSSLVCHSLSRGHFGVVRLVTEKGNPGKCYAMKVMAKSAVGTERAMAERNALAASRSDWITKLKFAFQNKRNLYKSQLVEDLFSKIKTTFVQVDNEWDC